MNSLIEAALSHSRTIMTSMVLLVAAGIISFISIPKEADPDIPIPIFYVSIVHQGISPEDAERLLIRPMETELRSLEGLKDITSIASQGHAGILLEFDVNFDKDAALQDVREKVDLARAELPSDTDEPIVREFNTALFPVLIVTLSGDVPERALYNAARKLKDEIEAVPTVLQAELVGHREELLEVVIDPAKLESYNISQSELINIVSLNNRLVAAGNIDTGQGRFSVKVPGLFETREDVLSLPIKVSGEGVVTLSDIASINRTFKDPDGYARFNGHPAIAIEITKRIGTNIIDNNNQVREAVEKFTEGWPEAIHVNYTLDASSWIFRALGSLQSSITTAIILVMIVIVAALGLRSAMLVGISIPTSFMIGFFFLASAGYTINMMVMFGMLLAVGMLVDGAIVVVEYADRKMSEGLDRREAYTLAAKRMFWPVASSTATTLAAFLPMLLWPGVSGKFMSYLPITLIVVLSASLLTALIFVPTMGTLFGKAETENDEVLKQLAATETGDIRGLPGLTGAYVRLLEKLVYYPGRVMAATGVVLVGTIMLFSTFNNGVEFFVDTEPEQAIVLVSARGNLSAQDTLALARDVEDIVLRTEGVKTVFTRTGPGLGSGSSGRNDVPKDLIAQMMIELKPYEERRKGAVILEEIRQNTKSIPGIKVELRKQEDGPPTGKDIQIELTSTDYQKMLATTATIRHHLDTEVDGLIDVEDGRPLPGIEWIMSVDREMAGRFGADVTSVGAVIQLVTNGIMIGEYRPDDAPDEVDIRARFPDDYRVLDQLDSLRVQTQQGLVPISNFVSREAQSQVSTIERINGYRRIMVKANTAIDPATGEKINVDEKVREISAWIADQNIDPAVRVQFRGANEEQAESASFLGGALIGALFLMFIILLTQFNSFYHSILTLSTVILSTVGVLIGMVVTGQPFSVIMTGTGIVALAGIVVNNSIVLIDTYQRLREDTADAVEAVLRTAGQRLRPIMLTTITTMFGLLPMALQINLDFVTREIVLGGPVSVWWVQLSTAIIFGLGFSTLLTLVLIPVLLAAPSVIRAKRAARRDGNPEWQMTEPTTRRAAE
ncbi:acriflavin resistance protein [Parvibaculum lavamentivorans DS-1]|uniref:Acriflavin resistance protein n=1 Tax=Parvibaculum lavamentivorans (strain DS-1 / DSM 13023 / NCIMB 13966) TaxID=402881 RepID=A7HPG0_PARL1|nr:efflux RND transporter permease subunit [Parvibaculum lavamentivorans]ABS61793.1 acriflavin resistance protein [Parvibaculum lavamentivorans DS-1]